MVSLHVTVTLEFTFLTTETDSDFTGGSVSLSRPLLVYSVGFVSLKCPAPPQQASPRLSGGLGLTLLLSGGGCQKSGVYGLW